MLFCKQSRPRVYPVCFQNCDMSDPTLVDLTSKFFILCTNMNVYLYNSELILGCGSVKITLFLQYWPKISSSLRSYSRNIPRFGAFPVILRVLLVIPFTFPTL